MKKPYSNDILEFNLDNRMLKSWWKDLIKDENINNLYWISILNPFKSNNNKEKSLKIANWYKNNINIPILLYPEIIEKFEKWYKYSFSLWENYIKNFRTHSKMIEQKEEEENHILQILHQVGQVQVQVQVQVREEAFEVQIHFNYITKINAIRRSY